MKLSIIVPVYNVESYIDKCLESLVNQTIDEMEIIIVNDGSTDNSYKIIEKYIKRYPEKIIYLTKKNGGLSDARNFGLKYANGEYVGFVDSDDYIDVTTYEKMYKKAQQEDADMVECDFYWVYQNRMKKDIGTLYNTKKEMFQIARVMACNKIIRRKIIDDAKVEFPKGLRYEDTEFFYKLLPFIEKVGFVKEPLYFYIQRGTSICNTQNEKTTDMFKILNNVLEYYKENNLYEEYKDELEYIYVKYLLGSSFLRMVKIRDDKMRKNVLRETWNMLNKAFPKWRKNQILRNVKTKKHYYYRSVNRFTFLIYSYFFRLKENVVNSRFFN